MRRLLALGLFAACSGDTSLPIEPQCNPLGAGACMVPFPSSAFEVDDPTTATGRRVAIPEGALPASRGAAPADPSGWNAADGFSPSAPILMAFPGGVSATGLPPLDNMDRSLAADSPTVILDMTTGERVAHFAELDAAGAATPDSQALLLRPAGRLAPGHRYAVAITTRVVAADGGPLEVPPGFAALRDDKRTDHPLAEALRPRFAEVLDTLEDAGIPSDELVVAWDFTVASEAFLGADLAAARERARGLPTRRVDRDSALPRRAPARPELAITSDVTEAGARTISGTVEVPLFLSNAGEPRANTRLVRDTTGLPVLQGSYRIPFTALVPACARRASAPVPMVLYGHRPFGDPREVTTRRATAEALCMIFVGTTLRGLADVDGPAVERVLSDIERADEVFGVLVQGVLDQVALVSAMRGALADDVLVTREGRRLAARDKIYFYGVAPLGGTVLALAPAIARGVLAVGGANFSMTFDRSRTWRDHARTLHAAYPDPLDAALAIALLQMRWDRVERLDAKQQLLQIALGDDEVPNVAAFWQARSLELPVLGPSPTTPWGLTVEDGPLRGSALVIMDGGAPLVPVDNVPAPTTGMHELTRSEPAARRQIKRFFETGQISNECDGPCLCATGACK